MAPFGHLLTAMITPFTSTGEVDYERTWRLARFLVDNGSEGLVVTGTTGESPTLTNDEKVALYRTVVEAVGDKAQIVAGTGTYNTAESVELTRRAAEVGCHAVMAVTPYYSKPPQEGIFRHMTAIAEATDLSLLVYNIPGRTCRLIEIDTIARLAEHESIVAVKDAVESIEFTSRTVNRIPGFPVYSGQDSHTWPMMAVGAIGVVSVISHLAGRMVAAMVEAALAGNMSEARRLHHELLPLCEACFLETNPTPVKGAMNRLWEPVGDVRLPLVAASEETLIAVEKAVGAIQGL